MSWETFNERYGAHVDAEIKYSLEYNILDQDSYMSHPRWGGKIFARKAPYYKIPPEVVEFCNTINVIVKLHAYTLDIYDLPRATKFSNIWCVHEDTDPTINYFDWVKLFDELHVIDNMFYVNCNPQSQYYRNILMTFGEDGGQSGIMYRNVGEFIVDYHEWMSVTGVRYKFNVDTYLSSYKIPVRELFSAAYDGRQDIECTRHYILRRIHNLNCYADINAALFSSWILHRKN
jgi:hypothetical protein